MDEASVREWIDESARLSQDAPRIDSRVSRSARRPRRRPDAAGSCQQGGGSRRPDFRRWSIRLACIRGIAGFSRVLHDRSDLPESPGDGRADCLGFAGAAAAPSEGKARSARFITRSRATTASPAPSCTASIDCTRSTSSSAMQAQRQAVYWIVGAVILGGSGLALAWVYMFLRRERGRELAQLEAEKAREHAEVLMLEAKVGAQEAERAAEETKREVLERTVDAAKAEGARRRGRANESRNAPRSSTPASASWPDRTRTTSRTCWFGRTI